MNIAIFTPDKNSYSETFIQAHKTQLNGTVFYYYGTKKNMKLEGSGSLVSKQKHLRLRLDRKLKRNSFSSLNDQIIVSSLKARKIHAVLVEYGTHAHAMCSMLKQSGLPIVVHFHGYDASIHTIIKKCNNYREVFALASKVIVVSRAMEKKLLDLGCYKEKLVYSVYGPYPDFETVVPSFAKKQFLSVGRFADKKAPYYTIMAFNEVVKAYPDASLIMAGDGLLMNMCQNLVRFYGLENNVQFLGIISPETYRNLLSESLAFVQHSITAHNGDSEGTPVAVLEASAAGLPVVSTFHAGIPDVIIHNETGLLCEEHDVDGMAKHMTEILENQALAYRLGQSGKKRVKAHFTMDHHIGLLNTVLEGAVNNH